MGVAIYKFQKFITVTITVRDCCPSHHSEEQTLKYLNQNQHPVSLNGTVARGSYIGKMFLSPPCIAVNKTFLPAQVVTNVLLYKYVASILRIIAVTFLSPNVLC